MAGEFKQVSVQSLECPVCLNIFSDPKILSCSHTYCKACLERLVECHGDDSKLICPVCRAETQVPNQDITQLQTDLVLKSLVDEVKNQHQCCTHCRSEEKPQAVVYCRNCDKDLCVTCHNTHSIWNDFSDHVVIPVSEITSGKVAIRRHRKCRKHPEEDEKWLCCHCRRFVCCRCGMDHAREGHQVFEASVYESNHMKNVEDLQSKAEKKEESIQKYVDFIHEEKECVSKRMKQCIDDINEAYKESVQQLAKKKELLINEVKGRKEKVDKELDRFKELAQQQITHMTTITDLVAKGTKIPLDTDALTAHDTLCQELQGALKQKDPDYRQPQTLSEKGKCVTFEKKVKTDELNLGEIVDSVEKIIELPMKNSMYAMVPTPDGRMAVGCSPGGIKIFSADGKLHQTVLKDVRVQRLEFLSDGRYVIRDTSEEISVYTPEFEKLDVRFETLNDKEDWGGLAVDNNDQIYVGYKKAKKIKVFSPAGGKAIREIPCNDYEPMQITCYKDFFIIGHSNTVAIIDNDGNVKYEVGKKDINPFAAVTQDKAIMIAWVNHDDELVTIEEYTNELEHVKTLISNYKFEKPQDRWYSLQEFRSGEIGFCTTERLYILRGVLSPSNGTVSQSYCHMSYYSTFY